MINEYNDKVRELALQRKWGQPFTKSNGTILARIYERLTRASRRRVEARKKEHYFPLDSIKQEAAYRRGVSDTLRALQEELARYVHIAKPYSDDGTIQNCK